MFLMTIALILFIYTCILLHTEKQHSQSSWDYVAAGWRPKQVSLNKDG